jgi:CRP/FNR family transcriptional regulator, cyclic AMP receptor protein
MHGMQRSLAKEGDQRLKARLIDWQLSEQVIETLLGHHHVVSYSKGSAVFLQGAPADVLYWVQTGLVVLYHPQADGERVFVRLSGPGELIGYADFIDDTGRRVQAFEAFTRTNCQIALLTREHVYKVLREINSDMLVKLLEHLSTAWSIELQRWVKFVGLDYRQRLELVLSDLARGYGVKEARGTLLLAQLSHQDLAEMIGSSRPMVSRLLSDMIEQRLIARHDGHYIIRNNSEREESASRKRAERNHASAA